MTTATITTKPATGVRPIIRVPSNEVPKKTPEEYQRDHERALIRLLAPKHFDLVIELAEGLAK